MSQAMNNWNVQLIGMLGIAAAVFGVFWAAEGLEQAWPSAADRTLSVLCAVFGVTFFAAVAVLARRS